MTPSTVVNTSLSPDLQFPLLYVAVSASHVTLSCDCGKFSVVYSSIDHINATQLSSPILSCNTPLPYLIILAYITQFPFSVPGTTLTHSLVYKYLYSVPRSSELRLLLLFPSPSSNSSSPSSPLFVTHLQIWKFWSPEFPRSLALGNPGSLRDSTGNRAIP